MKTTSLRPWALALACTSAVGAYAQSAPPPSSVTLYGLIDAGVEIVSNVADKGTIQRMPSNTGSVPSRVGFRGNEDLGNGLRAVFTAEMGFAPDMGTSAQGGRLFGRQAFVGLAGPWGAVTVGRQYSMLFWSMMDSDVVGPAVYAIGSLDPYIPNSRADNALAYRGTFGGLQLGAQYSFGRDTVNAGPSPVGTNCPGEGADSKACRQWSLLGKYDTTGWGVSLAYDQQHGRALFFGDSPYSNSQQRRAIDCTSGSHQGQPGNGHGAVLPTARWQCSSAGPRGRTGAEQRAWLSRP